MTAERRWQNQIPPTTIRQPGNFSLQVITFPGFETSAYAKTCDSSSTGTTGFLQGLLRDEAVASLSCAALLCEELQYQQAMTATFGFKSRPERGSQITLRVFQAHFLHSSSPLKKPSSFQAALPPPPLHKTLVYVTSGLRRADQSPGEKEVYFLLGALLTKPSPGATRELPEGRSGTCRAACATAGRPAATPGSTGNRDRHSGARREENESGTPRGCR